MRGAAVATTCSYVEKAEGKVSESNPKSDAEDMRKRINRLESSIRSMMEEKTKADVPSPVASNNSLQTSDSTETHDGTGDQKMSVDTRSTHWDAILNDVSISNSTVAPLTAIIGAMKDGCSEENDHEGFPMGFLSISSTRTRRPDLLNGPTDLPDRATIMSSLPYKNAAVRLVACFFDNYNPSIPAQGKYAASPAVEHTHENPALIHKPSFLKQVCISCPHSSFCR